MSDDKDDKKKRSRKGGKNPWGDSSGKRHDRSRDNDKRHYNQNRHHNHNDVPNIDDMLKKAKNDINDILPGNIGGGGIAHEIRVLRALG